jgi:hypothetical protein
MKINKFWMFVRKKNIRKSTNFVWLASKKVNFRNLTSKKARKCIKFRNLPLKRQENA